MSIHEIQLLLQFLYSRKKVAISVVKKFKKAKRKTQKMHQDGAVLWWCCFPCLLCVSGSLE